MRLILWTLRSGSEQADQLRTCGHILHISLQHYNLHLKYLCWGFDNHNNSLAPGFSDF
jgi:hypothetical protein